MSRRRQKNETPYWDQKVVYAGPIGLSHQGLVKQRGLKGSKFGPANSGRRLSKDEARKIEDDLRRQGKIT